jgi:hypothetical protein
MSPRATVAAAIVAEINFIVAAVIRSPSALTPRVHVGFADVEAGIYEQYSQLQLLSVRRQPERGDQ